MLLCLCQSVSSYGAVLTHGDVSLWNWSFLLGFSSNFFSREGFLSAGFFPGGYGLFPLSHCFVLPPASQVTGDLLHFFVVNV